jgi:tetratricopeptide (TPR) repeat protein
MIVLAAALLMQPSFDALAKQAAAARDAKHPLEALALYRKALHLKPDWAEGLWEAGSIEYDQDHYKECATDFRRLGALKPDQPPAFIMAGLCEYHLKDYDAAFQSLMQAQKLGLPGGADLARAARLHLALVLIKRSNFEKAITTLVELTRDDKKTPEIVVASGIAGLREAWTPPEVPESERDKVFKLGDAMAAVMEQDSKEAVDKFAVVVRDYPNDANVHFRYGAFLVRGQDEERGLEEIRKAVELQPDHIPALVGLASLYLKRDQPKAAREFAEKAVKLAPGDFATHVELGRVLRALDDPAGAIKEFETAVKIAPGSPESHYDLASVYAQMGRTQDAARERQEFRRLRKITDPNQP